LKDASKIGDVFVTATGDKNVVSDDHFLRMKDGAIVANSGHFNVEIDIPSLEKLSKRKRKIRDFVEEYTLKNSKKIFLLAEGRLINLSSAEGHPAVVMDMSFSNQALSILYLKREGKSLQKKVYPVPKEIDQEIARMKLKAIGIRIDRLSAEQKKYLSGWEEGT
jgi:adenosylhomocysteinase